MKTARTYVFIFVPIPSDWGARASRVLVAVSRRNRLSLRFQRVGDFALSEKVRDGENAIASTRDACAPQPSVLDLVYR